MNFETEALPEGLCYSHDWDDHMLVHSTDWDDPYIDWSQYRRGYFFIHREDGPRAGPFETAYEAMQWWNKLL